MRQDSYRASTHSPPWSHQYRWLWPPALGDSSALGKTARDSASPKTVVPGSSPGTRHRCPSLLAQRWHGEVSQNPLWGQPCKRELWSRVVAGGTRGAEAKTLLPTPRAVPSSTHLPWLRYLLVLQLVLALPDDVAFLQQLLLGLLKLLLALQGRKGHDTGVNNTSFAGSEPLPAVGHPWSPQSSRKRLKARCGWQKHHRSQNCPMPLCRGATGTKPTHGEQPSLPAPTWR